MKILYVGYPDAPIIHWLREMGEEVTVREDRLDALAIEAEGYEFLVSYGYRHILRKDVLSLFPDRAINLHVSYLPWNRGADPNPWSILENTPRGVTIHHLDEGIDTGDVIVQREVAISEDWTLAEAYARLQHEIQDLFRANWQVIRSGTAPRTQQSGKGSHHKVADRIRFQSFLTHGWDTKISDLIANSKKG